MAYRSWLARLGLAGVLTLAGTGVAVGTAAPASATVANALVAAPAGTITINAVATCPAGQYLTGAAGAVAGGGGDVTLTDVVPDLGARTVTVWGHANGGAVPGAYTVQAQAICLPGPPPANYQLVTSASAVNPAAKRQAVACPAGTNLLGLGASLNGANGNVLYQAIEPNAALTAGRVSAGAAAGFAAPWQVIGYGICGTAPAGVTPTLASATGPVNNTTPKLTPSPVCPAGAVTTGVGGTVQPNAIGNVMLSRTTANAAQDTALAGADADGLYGPTWTLTAHNICWG